jgi:hypothetical protein
MKLENPDDYFLPFIKLLPRMIRVIVIHPGAVYFGKIKGAVGKAVSIAGRIYH